MPQSASRAAHGRGIHHGAVVASDVFRGSMLLDEPAHNLAHLMGVDLAIHMDAEAFTGVFIDDVEHTELSSSHGGDLGVAQLHVFI